MKTKSEIRQEIRKKRATLTPEQKKSAANNCFQRILAEKLLNNAQHVGIYFSNDHELDLSPLLQYCLESNFHCYLPVLNNNSLGFMSYSYDTKLVPNKYNIPEPVQTTKNKQIAPQDLDIVFVPLVAFTRDGNRLGMGGGYYDRTFAFLANSFNNITKPILIGVAYDLQCVESIPIESWDVRIQGIVTESRYINVEKT